MIYLRCEQDFKEFEALDFGEWEALQGGVRWHLALRSPGASSLALLFRYNHTATCPRLAMVVWVATRRLRCCAGKLTHSSAPCCSCIYSHTYFKVLRLPAA